MSLNQETTPSIDSITSIRTQADLAAYNLQQAGLDPTTEAGGECPIPPSMTTGTVGTAKSVVQVSIPPSIQVSVPPVSETSSN